MAVNPCCSAPSKNIVFYSETLRTETIAYCTERINDAIQKAKLEICSKREDLKPFYCPIDLELVSDPVVTNCGHLFNKTAIEAWLKNNKNCLCPTCRKEILLLAPDYATKQFIANEIAKDYVPTFQKEKGKLSYNDYLHLAEDNGSNGHNTTFIKKAIRCAPCIDTMVYAFLPKHYKKIGKLEKTHLSRLYLGLYQLSEKNHEQAIKTLKKCDQIFLSIMVELAFFPTKKNVFYALKNINYVDLTWDEKCWFESKIFQFAELAFNYNERHSRTENQTRKRQLFKQAGDYARQNMKYILTEDFWNKAAVYPKTTVLHRWQWDNKECLKIPNYPSALKNFLAEDCTIWPGKKRIETHIVVPLFPRIKLDKHSEPEPFSLKVLKKLENDKCIIYDVSDCISLRDQFCWGVLTNSIIPATCYKSESEQRNYLPDGYKVPKPIDVVYALLWHYNNSGNSYINEPFTYCKGLGLDTVGFVVGTMHYTKAIYCTSFTLPSVFVGLAGWREFKVE